MLYFFINIISFFVIFLTFQLLIHFHHYSLFTFFCSLLLLHSRKICFRFALPSWFVLYMNNN